MTGPGAASAPPVGVPVARAARRHPSRGWLAALLLLVAAVYARSVANDFAYDDRHYVRAPTALGHANPLVAEWQGLATYFTSPYGAGALEGGRGLRPMTVMSFALVHLAAGPAAGDGAPQTRAGPQHLANVLLHVAATALAYRLVRRLFPASRAPALVGAALFGLHALRSDPVISIVGRAEVLAFVFGALGTEFYLHALGRRGAARLAAVAAAAAAFFAAFASKESALAWAGFAPLFGAAWLAGPGRPADDGAPAARLRRQALPFVASLVVPAAAFAALWLPILSSVDFAPEILQNPLFDAEPAERALTGVVVLGYGLYQVLWPFDLHIDYGFHTFAAVESAADPRFLAAAAALLCVLVGAVVAARRHPPLALAGAAFLVFAFGTSNVAVPIETLYGERLMYTPALALSLAAAWLAHRLAERPRRARAPAVAAAAWLVVSCAVIVQRCTVWQDNETLLVHEAERQPRSQALQSFAGRLFRIEGQALGFEGPRGEHCEEQWERYLERALAAHPDRNHPLPLNDLAYLHLDRRDRLLARGLREEALAEERGAEERIERAFASPFFRPEHGATLHVLAARIAERRGDRAGHSASLERALAAGSGDPLVHLHLAAARLGADDRARAAALAQRAAELDPRSLATVLSALELAEAAGDGDALAAILAQARGHHRADVPGLQVFRAVRLARAGRTGEARALLEAALPRFGPGAPTPQVAFLEYPRCLAEEGDVARALRLADEGLARPGLRGDVRARLRRLRERLAAER